MSVAAPQAAIDSATAGGRDLEGVALLNALRRVVGKASVLTGSAATLPYRTGFRFGGGPALAVIRPRSLVALWRALEACVEADAVVIMQAANTGLTGGSTPSSTGDGRPVVIISTTRLTAIHLVLGGRQAICLPGATLYALEAKLAPLDRQPHSVIGSSCIGASVVGGVCNNSGGALVRRGPAFTELALYARLDENRQLELVNALGLKLDGSPEQVLMRLEAGDFASDDVFETRAQGSDTDYERRVRQIDADTPARFNADPDRLHGASGSAGKVAVFAVRLDTFPNESVGAVFYVGTNDPAELTELRRTMLSEFEHLPIAAEYMHRTCFDIAARYGKDTFLAIRCLGTARLPNLFRAKSWIDRVARALGCSNGVSDRLLQVCSAFFPAHLPKRMREYRDRYEHHLMLRVTGEGLAEAGRYFAERFPSGQGDVFRCTTDEAEKAFLHRFVAAGAAVRYRSVHPEIVEDIVALDIALRRNDREWVDTLPPELSRDISHALHYGHFFCHVFHRDYILTKGADLHATEAAILARLDERGAEYPAEHNVGHLYPAKPALAAFYRALDPCNTFNPGIGRSAPGPNWT